MPARRPTGTTLLAERRSVAPGGTVTVPVYLERASQVGSMNFTLTYDASVLRVNKVDLGDLVRGRVLFQANIKDAGIIRFGLAVQSGQEINGVGPVAHVEFTALGPEGSSSTLAIADPFATDVSAGRLNLGLIDGLVTIEQKPRGDFDGDRCSGVKDALAALQMSVGERTEDLNLDMDQDNRVSAEDARLILREAVTTPCETAN